MTNPEITYLVDCLINCFLDFFFFMPLFCNGTTFATHLDDLGLAFILILHKISKVSFYNVNKSFQYGKGNIMP